MKAALISIGNELLNGRTVNSNATFIGGKLFEIGVRVREIFTIRDEPESITNALTAALATNQIVLVTGGLGPTHDDITKKVIAGYFDSKLIFDESIVQRIEQKFRERGMRMPETNREQGFVPETATLIDNPVGTAPGLHFRQNGSHIFAMPGVPREMRAMVTDYILPLLSSEFQLKPTETRLFRTTRIPESGIYERCQHFLDEFSDLEIAFLPKFTGVDIRVTLPAIGDFSEKIAAFEQKLTQTIGKYIFTTEEDAMEATVGKLLKSQNLTLSVAESCTGGLIQQQITSVAGSSDYFSGGVVSYSNESKIKLLGVSPAALEKYGAVSEIVAQQMAEGIRQSLGTDFGISTTGIAGPGGGTAEKPVGLIFIGLATPDGTVVRQFNLGKDRHINQQQTAIFALDMLRRRLNGIPA
ncbi:MAG: competence/damage-inducible protein A [Calditrichae bacterium]|nr:competence/damage-inducible protein A [Calditrichia bacterium]